jgi:putative Mg2+ transporter-C (MgtC) family protein
MITVTSWVGNSVPIEYYVRILISAVLGLLIGFDRTHKNKLLRLSRDSVFSEQG